MSTTSHAEKNKNPGNIMYFTVDENGKKSTKKSDYAKYLESIGIEIEPGSSNNHGQFIKFKNAEDGIRASQLWWPTVKNWAAYKDLTVNQALKKYSGNGYDLKKLKIKGIDPNSKIANIPNDVLSSIMDKQLQFEDPDFYNKYVKEDPVYTKAKEQASAPPNIDEIREKISTDIINKKTGKRVRLPKESEYEASQDPKNKSDFGVLTEDDFLKLSEKEIANIEKLAQAEFEKQQTAYDDANIYLGERAQKIEDAQKEADKKIVDAKTEEEKKKAEEEKGNLALINFKEDAAAIMQSFGRVEPIPEKGFVYNKDDYKKQLPLEALGQGALGLLGLASADNELPLRDEKVSEATMAFLAENRRLSKMGLPPELESQAKRQLQESTALGIENLKRASGGNRNAILANIGGLDANRAKGIAALNIADMQARDEAFARYGQTLQYIDNFNKERDVANHNIKLNEALTERAEGKALAGSAFSNMLNEIQYQRENGPGSANDMFKKNMEYEMFGYVHGMEDNGKPGSKSYKIEQDKKAQIYNSKIEKDNETGKVFRHNINNMTPEEKKKFYLSGNSMEDLFTLPKQKVIEPAKPILNDTDRWGKIIPPEINFEDKLIN